MNDLILRFVRIPMHHDPNALLQRARDIGFMGAKQGIAAGSNWVSRGCGARSSNSQSIGMPCCRRDFPGSVGMVADCWLSQNRDKQAENAVYFTR